jgi:hypothetical protein
MNPRSLKVFQSLIMFIASINSQIQHLPSLLIVSGLHWGLLTHLLLSVSFPFIVHQLNRMSFWTVIPSCYTCQWLPTHSQLGASLACHLHVLYLPSTHTKLLFIAPRSQGVLTPSSAWNPISPVNAYSSFHAWLRTFLLTDSSNHRVYSLTSTSICTGKHQEFNWITK